MVDIFLPIQWFADWVTYDLLGIGNGTYLGDGVNFFIYDLIKIGFMLVVINYLMAVIRYYFPMEKVRDILAKRRWFGLDYLFAAFLGVITPFCSCSSIPLFIGFMRVRIPIGVTFAFLISSPLINEASLYLFPAIFGLKVTLIYNVLGIILAMAGGFLIQKINLEKYIDQSLLKSPKMDDSLQTDGNGKNPGLKELAKFWWADGWIITKQVFPYVVLGVGIGALIHGFVPASLVDEYLSAKTWWSVPAAVIVGAPLYANSIGVVPVIEALALKGMPLGNLLAFMTAIVAVSLPELIILNKILKWRLLAAFLAVTLFAAMIIGYVFNAIV
ncbi:MAG: permease [Candidatus Micrarchaeota archaeon]